MKKKIIHVIHVCHLVKLVLMVLNVLDVILKIIDTWPLMDNVSVWMDSMMMELISVKNVAQSVTLVKDLLHGVLIVSGQELVLQIVAVQKEPSVTMILVNMNVNTVLTNVLPVKKNLKLVSFVPVTESIHQIVPVHQVTSTNQKMPPVPDVPKNVKHVPTVDHVPLVMLQESMLHTVTVQPVNSKFAVLKVKSPVILNVQILNVTIVTTNVILVEMLGMIV
jgi:hypothetical protein